MRRNNISTPREANATHYKVGKEIRGTMERLGNVMPENLPLPDKSIKQIEQEKKKAISNK